MVMGMTLHIPDSVLQCLRIPDGEIASASGPNSPSLSTLKEHSHWERPPNSRK